MIVARQQLYSPAVTTDSLRVDRWLWQVRLFKSRSLAADAVHGGKVHVNGERAKPSRPLRIGDRITLMRVGVEFECEARALPARRGPAAEAARCYDELPASRLRREQQAARLKAVAGILPRPAVRPDKHQRRQLRRLRGRET